MYEIIAALVAALALTIGLILSARVRRQRQEIELLQHRVDTATTMAVALAERDWPTHNEPALRAVELRRQGHLRLLRGGLGAALVAVAGWAVAWARRYPVTAAAATAGVTGATGLILLLPPEPPTPPAPPAPPPVETPGPQGAGPIEPTEPPGLAPAPAPPAELPRQQATPAPPADPRATAAPSMSPAARYSPIPTYAPTGRPDEPTPPADPPKLPDRPCLDLDLRLVDLHLCVGGAS